MALTAENWSSRAKVELSRLKEVLADGKHVPVYGAAAALALWPVVQALQGGGAASVDAMLGVLAGAGLSVITQPLTDWLGERKKRGETVDEGALARQLSALAAGDLAVRDALDAQLVQLQAFEVGTHGLDEATIGRIVGALREELISLKNVGRFEDALTTIIQTGGGAYVAGNVTTHEFSGRDKIVHGNYTDNSQTTNNFGELLKKPAYTPPDLPPLEPDGRPPLLSPGTLPPSHRLPLPANALFTGREDELRGLAAELLPYDVPDLTGFRKPVRSKSVIISTGIGGVGKTQLAAEFAHRYGRFFHGVHWVSLAEAANVAGEVALCGQAMGLHPAFSELPLPDQVALVRRVWAGPEARLLVFDNCEAPELLAEWQPRGGGARLLVTSRREVWPDEMALTRSHINPLPVPDSVLLLQRTLTEGDGRPPRTDVSDDDLTAIARELGELPLALGLAGRYLRAHRHETAEAYLEALRRPDLLDHPSLRAAGYTVTGHDLDVWRSFAVSLDRLQPDKDETDRLAVKLLARAACFSPGEPLPEELLVMSLVTEGDDEQPSVTMVQAENGLERLLETGLLERVDSEAVRLHRLLRRFAAAALAAEMGAARGAAEKAAISRAFQQNMAGYPRALGEWETHLRHLTEVALLREDDQAATLATNLGYYLRMRGDYAAARPLYERAIEIDTKVYGPDHPSTAVSLNNLAGLLYAQGDYAAARPLHERALAIRERVLGPDHPDTALGLNNLAELLRVQGDYAAARPLYERALAIKERVLGPDHPDIATSLNNLAGLKQAQGDYAAARPLYERAIEIDTKVYGPDHPEVATDINNLAGLLKVQGDYAAARPLYERALAIRERVLGPDHPYTATSLNNLAGLLESQGDYAAARPLYERALAIRERVLGPDHPSTATSLNNLAGLLESQGDYAAARPLYERALAIRERVLGPDHPDTAQSLNNLASLLYAQGDYAAARPLFERALAILEERLGPDHPTTKIVRGNLARLVKPL